MTNIIFIRCFKSASQIYNHWQTSQGSFPYVGWHSSRKIIYDFSFESELKKKYHWMTIAH